MSTQTETRPAGHRTGPHEPTNTEIYEVIRSTRAWVVVVAWIVVIQAMLALGFGLMVGFR